MGRSRRFTIAGLMAVVLVASLGLAALRTASPTCAGGLFLVTHGVLALALVGAACRGASERAWWLGFAVFGLGYLRGPFMYGFGPYDYRRIAINKLPTTVLLDVISRGMFGRPSDDFEGYFVVGHCLLSLLAATIGGVLAQALFAAPAGPPANQDAGPPREGRPARMRWRRLAAVGLPGLVAFTALALAGRGSDPALWAGALYLLTWVLLGVAALGFACGRGERRMVWLGAALFGLGYMVLNRSPDRFENSTYGHLVADEFLNALRPWLPSVIRRFPAETAAEAIANARIREALDRPVPMPFPHRPPLSDVLAYVRAATRAPDGREVPIYVDPVGLQEAERTMQSTVQIDLEGVPLRDTLRLALQQLGLVYRVRGGVLDIICESTEDAPVEVDYYLLLGHCLLALLAAGLGAWLVPLVSGRRSRPPARIGLDVPDQVAPPMGTGSTATPSSSEPL